MPTNPVEWLRRTAGPVVKAALGRPPAASTLAELVEEVERLKWRHTRLATSLRYALLGFPARDATTSRFVEGLADLRPPEDDPMQAVWTALGVQDATALHGRRGHGLARAALADLRPRSALVLDGESVAATTGLLAAFPGVEALTVVDPGDRLSAVWPAAERLSLDAAAAARGLVGRSFDLILCCHTYERLSPWSQQGFVAAAAARLSPGGALLLSALDPQAAPDAYWANPLNLRPWSRAALTAELARAGAVAKAWTDGPADGAELLAIVRRPPG